MLNKEDVQLVNKEVTKLVKSIGKKMEEYNPETTNHIEFGDESIDNELDFDDFSTNSDVFSLTFIEFAVLNEYLYSTFRKENKNLVINNYGGTDSVGRISYGGSFNIQYGWWFQGKFVGDENEYIFQTKIYMDNRKDIISEIQISVKNGVSSEKLYETMKNIKNLAFNNSKYVGKCIKVKLKEGGFRGIEIIDISNFSTELILNETQTKFLNHFVARVGRGGNARYLLNGEPGTGKTESIREIIRKLTPNVTFIIPDFTTNDDLNVILEACEIFESAVIIMDDIDLYLGSRDKGGYTTLLGQFLSFFDGVKKRKISLLASTNDKGLVDRAAERPGRFNMTLDYTFLTSEQIVSVCQIHLPKEYQTQEVYDVLTGTINGKKVNVTGAFIANLADNIKEMSEDEDEWFLSDTLSLIKESYKGFYMSQVEKDNGLGFKFD